MKYCPVCNDIELRRILIEDDLPVHECRRCGGIWLSAYDYHIWLAEQDELPSQEADASDPLPVIDTDKLIVCPDCKRFLRRFKIWTDIDFHLDRCKHCNGVWFDKNEWQNLKRRNLHKQIHHFFTEPWQNKLRREETKKRFEKLYLDRFGAEDYAEIKRIKTWLAKHPQGPHLLAYLTDPNPYKG